MIKLSNFMA